MPEMTEIHRNTITYQDITDYLTMLGEEDLADTISQWSEGIAYDLYTSKSYRNLKGYILYYMYEVITNNMKKNHFGLAESKAGLQYYSHEPVLYQGRKMNDGALLTRYTEIKLDKDMRSYGEEPFLDFMTYYMKDLITGSLRDKTFKWSSDLTYRLENMVQFIHFAVKDDMGILTVNGYRELKDDMLKHLEEEVEVNYDAKGRKRESSSFMLQTVVESFERAELMGGV